MSIRSASRSTSTIRRNGAFRVVQLTPLGSSCSIQIGNGLTAAPVGSLRNVYLVVTDLEAARNRLLESGVEVGEIRHKTPIGAWDGGFAPGLDPARAETMPASPTSPIRMATAGCYRNGATAVCDVMWKVGDVDHTRRSKNTQEERSPSPLFSRSSIVSLLLLFSLRQKSKAMLAVAVTARCAKLASGYQKPEAKYSRVSPVPSAQMNLQWVVIDFSMLAIQWNMTCKCH